MLSPPRSTVEAPGTAPFRGPRLDLLSRGHRPRPLQRWRQTR